MSNNTVTINYGTGNSFTFAITPGTTFGALLARTDVKSRLGFGNNVEAHVGGVPQPNNNTVIAGDTVFVYDKQCSKAAAISVTVNYGTGNSRAFTFETPVTVSAVLAAARAVLGFGNNVEAHISGVPQPDNTTLVDGDTLYVYDKQCSKALSK